MYTSPKNPAHLRSFSFENWENKDVGKGQSKFYYNYNGKTDQYKNQYRGGDMPTFGDSQHDFRNKHKQNRRTTQYSNFDSQLRDRRDYQSRTNYSDDKWHRRQSTDLRTRDADYGTRLTRKDQSYTGSSYRIEDSLNSAYQYKRQSRIDFERSTEQKLTNIDKINQKIKKILNTLNQEEKKINQHHLKVGNKKTSNHSYVNRIKTEGDDVFHEKREKQNENIYSKLVGLRDRFQNQYDSSQGSGALRQIKTVENFQLTQKVNIGQKYEQNWRKDENRFAKWSRGGEDKQLRSRFLEDKSSEVSKEHVKTNYDKPCQLLKGTNVKSTDSLNLSTSICLKTEKDHDTKDYGYKRQKNSSYGYRNLKQDEANNSHSNSKFYQKYTTFKASEELSPAQYKNNTFVVQNERNDSGLEDFTKIQKSNQRWMDTIEKDPEESPTFTSFGGHKRSENTPVKKNTQKSILFNERSNKSCKLSNGKDLDVEIEKIQMKINNCENIKKELNLEEDEQIKKSRLQLNKSLSKYKEAKSSAQPKTWKRSVNDSNRKVAKFGASHNTYIAEFKPDQPSEQKSIVNELQNTQQKMQQNNESSDMEVCLPKPFKMCSKKTTKRTINNSEVREIESAFMSEDRESKKQESFKSLISHLCKQIELDTSFRNSKKWFNRKPNQSKWGDLGRELMTRRIGTTEQQNKQIFTMAEDEDNPFHTERDDEGSYAELINNFLNSEKHWIDHLQHRFLREEISTYLQEMDIDKKGNVTIEDMVRYINLESDKYYRNRDLSLVFRRLSGARGQVTIDYIIAQFCQ